MTNKETTGNSLVVQPLGLYAFTAGSIGSIPSQGTSIPQATLEAKKKEDTLKNSMELTQHGLLLHSCSCNDNYLSFFFFPSVDLSCEVALRKMQTLFSETFSWAVPSLPLEAHQRGVQSKGFSGEGHRMSLKKTPTLSSIRGVCSKELSQGWGYRIPGF